MTIRMGSEKFMHLIFVLFLMSLYFLFHLLHVSLLSGDSVGISPRFPFSFFKLPNLNIIKCFRQL